MPLSNPAASIHPGAVGRTLPLLRGRSFAMPVKLVLGIGRMVTGVGEAVESFLVVGGAWDGQEYG